MNSFVMKEVEPWSVALIVWELIWFFFLDLKLYHSFIFWTYIVAAYWNTTSWKISCISFCCHKCYFIWPHNTIPTAICQFTSVWYEHDEHTFSSATSSTAAAAAAKAKDDAVTSASDAFSATAEAIFFASFGTGVGFFSDSWIFLVISSFMIGWLNNQILFLCVLCVWNHNIYGIFQCRHNLWILKFSWGNHVSKFRRFIFLYPLKSAPVSLCMPKNHYWVKDHL